MPILQRLQQFANADSGGLRPTGGRVSPYGFASDPEAGMPTQSAVPFEFTPMEITPITLRNNSGVNPTDSTGLGAGIGLGARALEAGFQNWHDKREEKKAAAAAEVARKKAGEPATPAGTQPQAKPVNPTPPTATATKSNAGVRRPQHARPVVAPRRYV